MKVADFDYELPPELIAREPARPRDAARLLVHRVASARSTHARVSELERFLRPGDLLVLNDTRVLPARLFARRASGGRVELLLSEPLAQRRWRALAHPARKLRPGEILEVEGGGARVLLVERPREESGEPALEWIVELEPRAGESVEQLLERVGHVPLPPYVQRADRPSDRADYQTVYARNPGAIAAPTAGLHFTPELLARLEGGGVERAFLTLHVGIGTFRPVEAQEVEGHRMHAESYVLPQETALAIERCRARGGRVVAVGTTSVRVLESAVDEEGRLAPGRGRTSIFLVPGHRFRQVDALLTNFHLPRSTLLMLVCAFAGRERMLALYAEAVRERYRFYSYGDAMLLLAGE